MAFSAIPRLVSRSIGRKCCSTTAASSYTTASSSVERFWDKLQRNGGNIEKTLATVNANLDSSCVFEVLGRCSMNSPLLGLRFFIWAGLQSGYKHSSYMYGRACQLLQINRNPRVLADVIEAYRDDGFFISLKTFKVVLGLCREAKLSREGLWVLRKMGDFNCRPDTTAYNIVIRLFCGTGDMSTSDSLMKEMGSMGLYPDMITYNAMIVGFCKVGKLEDACALFKVMKENGCFPNAVAYSTLLNGVCRFGSVGKGLELLKEMEKEGGKCHPNVVSYTSVIQSFCEKGQYVEAVGILDHMEAHGCSPNRVTASIMIKSLCEGGRLEEAYKLVDRFIAGGSVSKEECWSSLVVSLVRIKELEEAEKVLKNMLAAAIMPNGLACSLLIKELCWKGKVLHGLNLYDEIERMGYKPSFDGDIHSIILVGLCQKSHIAEAAKLARLMLERNIHLKAPYVDEIARQLKDSNGNDIIMRLTKVSSDIH